MREHLRSEVAKDAIGVPERFIDEAAEEVVGELIADLTAKQKEAIKRITRRAAKEGWDEKGIVERVNLVVGLDSRRQVAVENHRQSLLQQGVPKGDARRLAREYATRLRAERATLIARNEMARLGGYAKRRAWELAADAGLIDQYAVRVWHTAKDEASCVVCAPMNGQRAAVGRAYKKNGSDGPPMHVNCRCTETLERGQKVLSKAARDGDGDGFIYDGTPGERPVPMYSYNSMGATWDDHHAQQRAIAHFDGLADDAMVIVYHGTTKEHAQSLMDERLTGVGRDRERKHASRSEGLYVAPTYRDALVYGDYVVRFVVKKRDIAVPEEMRGRTVGTALMNSSGGAVLKPGLALDDVTVVQKARVIPPPPGFKLPRDADRDGIIFEGTPRERLAPVRIGDRITKPVQQIVPRWEPNKRPGYPNPGEVVEMWVPYAPGTYSPGDKAGKHRPVLILGYLKGDTSKVVGMPFTTKGGANRTLLQLTNPLRGGDDRQSIPNYRDLVILPADEQVRRRLDVFTKERLEKYLRRVISIYGTVRKDDEEHSLDSSFRYRHLLRR